MNARLILLYQQDGAAVKSVISEEFVTILTVIFNSKYIKIKFDSRVVSV
jgi:hypothetical protein